MSACLVADALCTGYFETSTALMRRILDEESGPLQEAAGRLADQVSADRLIHIYGPGGHSNLASQEVFFRAGGLMHMSAILDEGTLLSNGALRSMAIERLTLAIDVPPERSVASVALAGLRPDGRWHVELDDERKGVDWVIPWVKERAAKNRLHAVVVDELSGLVEKRRDRYYLIGTRIAVTLAAAEGRDMAIACAKFYDSVIDQSLRHTDQPQMNVALSVARKRTISGGGWAWNRKDAASDITPIVAATLALWGAQNDNVKRPAARTSQRRAVVL